MSPAQRVAAALAAAALSVPVLAEYEGYVPVGYPDINGKPTACYGSTLGAVVGQRYTADQCVAMLARDAVSHGLDIDRCIAVEISPQTRAAFTSFSYNAGAPAFCRSTMARRLNAGDRAGACAELSKWTYSAGRELRGLVRRRAAERELCEKGLA